ncbi:MAG: tripartite tricarboxylate transporter substrate binding protein [Alphaproteobacteria bacterium]|nr:MAG: tripartite tricarboxylate transporter substrate binding protein [Alphaproteobacteria bacterium]
MGLQPELASPMSPAWVPRPPGPLAARWCKVANLVCSKGAGARFGGAARSAFAVLAVFAIGLADLAGHPVRSQSSRAVRLIVGFPPGGTTDVIARTLAEHISRTQSVSVLVENRPGAAASLAYTAVARAVADGNTLGINANSLVINPYLQQVEYNPFSSFEPVCNLLKSSQVIVVHIDSPYRTLTDLVNAARARPGELTLASSGPTTPQHIGFEQLKRAANFDMTQVPFSGGLTSVGAVLGGHVTSTFVNLSEVVEAVQAGKLRPLAVASRERIGQLPNVPTFIESGFREFELEVWYGVIAPAKTPKQTLKELENWFSTALQSPELKGKFATLGLDPLAMCGDDYAAFIRKQYGIYGDALRNVAR